MCHLGKIINYKCQCGKTLANKNIKEGLMKKFLKFGAALTALVLGLACFAACSNGNDDGGSSNNGGNVNNNGGGNTNNGGGNSNEEEEKPRVTIVAEWKTEDGTYSYKFYNNETYEFLERKTTTEKGKYYGISPKQKGTLTISQEYKYDDNAGDLIPYTNDYKVYIRKDDDGDLYLDDELYAYYYLIN